MKTLLTLLVLSWSLAATAGDGVLKRLKPGDDFKDGDEVSLVGKMITQEEEDEDGNIVTRAFLEQDDGGLIELPCESKDKDRGLLAKTADKAIGGKDACWDFIGEEVEIVGSAQKLQKKGKRWLRLGRITGISPL